MTAPLRPRRAALIRPAADCYDESQNHTEKQAKRMPGTTPKSSAGEARGGSTEAGECCGNPKCGAALEPSSPHLAEVFQRGVRHTANLLPLCPACFTAWKNGKLAQATLQAWKVLWLARSGEVDRRAPGLTDAALKNYPGLQPYFPDRYLDFPVAGGRIYLRLRESPMMLARALGRYEPDKMRVVRKLLPPGQTFLDVGANKGDFSVLAASLVGPEGRVLAFEPEPENCTWFEKSMALNDFGHVRLHPVALADSDGTATLHLGQKSGWHSLVPGREVTADSITVETRTLDSLLTDPETRAPDMIKIDVEGAEQQVLEGARQTLRHSHPILLIDLHPHKGISPEAICRGLIEAGYRIHNMKAPHEEIASFPATLTEILALPAERRDTLLERLNKEDA
ncbi:FkbM family methyltransferase [Thiohalobacter sp. IOR34]|uniref:FkbM family methyltransferase n=1 Tax=Thiohalobacter sp. IOR34 TaxID=3057176 RepID=UPI0025AF146D|nr:FkbM family methyltransferase [Thiohalobacter sp. IOR34]WJW75199.1 FkbM family methyltransferase [Thiohalobacter sp. IOR34]